MIHLIYGAKGSGKTKRIIDMANASIDTTTGDIVFITDTNRYMYDIKYQIRFINTEDNHIFTEEALLGFIKGLIAGNHDIKTIYIDGAHRIAKKTSTQCRISMRNLKLLRNVRTLSSSCVSAKTRMNYPTF